MSAQPQEKELTLDELAELWTQTKAAEDQHRKDRVAIEDAILAITDAKEEGSETTTTDHYKVTTTARLIRKIDFKVYDQIVDQIPEQLRPIKIKRELDSAGCKWLAANEPDVYRKLAVAIETKPGKVGFRIERVKEV